MKKIAIIILILLTICLFGCETTLETNSSDNSEIEKTTSGVNVNIEVEIGSLFQFGPYDWRVLAISEDSALLISEKVIESKAYHDKRSNVTWETCTLRKWLNTTFLENFSEDEQKAILTTQVSTEGNRHYGAIGGNTTEDKVFLLSVEEAQTYFTSDEDRFCTPNSTAKKSGISIDTLSTLFQKEGENTCWWWLRSPGEFNFCASCISNAGFVYDGDFCKVDFQTIGVRPALWIQFSMTE